MGPKQDYAANAQKFKVLLRQELIHGSWSSPILTSSVILNLGSMLPAQRMLMEDEEAKVNMDREFGMGRLLLYWQTSRCRDRKTSTADLRGHWIRVLIRSL